MTGPREIVPLAPGCPWSGWAPPDVQHCEANVCGWITTPANSWSNLAYFLAAAYLWRHHRPFALAAIGLGATSFIFHATFTAAGQALDYAGMFVYLALLLSLSAERLGIATVRRAFVWVLLAGGAGYAAARSAGAGVQWTVAGLTGLALGAEGAVGLKRPRASYRPFAAGLLLMAAAQTMWQLDYHRVLCDPDNHFFQGHAAWHLLSAAAIPFLAAFYAG